MRPGGDGPSWRTGALALVQTSQALLEEIDGPSILAEGEVRLARAVGGLDGERVIGPFGRDGESAVAHLDRLPMLAEHVPEARAQVGQHPAQTRLVAEARRERLRLAHQVQGVAVSTKRDQCDAKIESCVDGVG